MTEKTVTPCWHFRNRQRGDARCPLCRRALFRPGIRSGRRLLKEMDRAAVGQKEGQAERRCHLQRQVVSLERCLERHYWLNEWRHQRGTSASRSEPDPMRGVRANEGRRLLRFPVTTAANPRRG